MQAGSESGNARHSYTGPKRCHLPGWKALCGIVKDIHRCHFPHISTTLMLNHLLVVLQRPAISLELQAYNNATFTCPDQAGWQPKACLIEPAPGLGTSSVRTTCLPLQVGDTLAVEQGPDCEQGPGCLCYSSMRMACGPRVARYAQLQG